MSAVVAATAIGGIAAGIGGLGVGGVLAGAAAGAGIGAAASGAINASDANQTASSALSSQQQALSGLQYQPINIAQITSDAHNQAVANATQSLQLQQQLNPGVAAAQKTLQSQVSSQLALGGQLDPDTINEVTRAAEAGGGGAGLAGSELPLSAARLGETSQQLMQQRQANAASLIAANPLPETGLSPGSVADLEDANSNAANQFALSKLGVSANLTNSTIAASEAAAKNNAAAAGSAAGALTSPTTQNFISNLISPASSNSAFNLGLVNSSGLPFSDTTSGLTLGSTF